MTAELWTWLSGALGFWGFATAAFGATTTSLTIVYVARLRHAARMYELGTDREVKQGQLELARSEQQVPAILAELARLGREIETLQLTRQTGEPQPVVAEIPVPADQLVVQDDSPPGVKTKPAAEPDRQAVPAGQARKAARPSPQMPNERPASKRPRVPALPGLGSQAPAASPA